MHCAIRLRLRLLTWGNYLFPSVGFEIVRPEIIEVFGIREPTKKYDLILNVTSSMSPPFERGLWTFRIIDDLFPLKSVFHFQI